MESLFDPEPCIQHIKKKKEKKGIESVSYAKIKKGYFVYGVIPCWLGKEVDGLKVHVCHLVMQEEKA